MFMLTALGLVTILSVCACFMYMIYIYIPVCLSPRFEIKSAKTCVYYSGCHGKEVRKV